MYVSSAKFQHTEGAESFCFQGKVLDTSRQGRRIVSKGILVIQNISKFDAGKNMPAKLEIKFSTRFLDTVKTTSIFNVNQPG